jgi:hypothetical protein
MSGICPAKLSGIFSCPEYVWFYLSRICPELFHIQDLSSFFCT